MTILLRDYRHAEYTFRSDSFQYAPRFKFHFHVYFDVNPEIYLALNTPPNPNLGLTVKTIKLPQYSIQTHQMNQYNRKRIVNTKIKYEQVTTTFHDDNSNAVRNLWYNYYSYYFDDPNNTDTSSRINDASQVGSNTPISYDFTDRDQYKPKAPSVINGGWGYVGEGNQYGIKKPFFRSIIVYGFNQKKFVAYTLINPVITSFQHDTYSYNDGAGVMENQMSFDYEFVKYDEGAYNGENPSAMVLRFAEFGQNYDHAVSPGNYNSKQSDITTTNRQQVSNTTNSNGYNKPSPNPYDATGFMPSNADNNTYKNRLDILAAKNPIAQQAINQALIDGSNSIGRNIQFQSPVYGSTPSSIGTAGSIINPEISPDTDAVVNIGTGIR